MILSCDTIRCLISFSLLQIRASELHSLRPARSGEGAEQGLGLPKKTSNSTGAKDPLEQWAYYVVGMYAACVNSIGTCSMASVLFSGFDSRHDLLAQGSSAEVTRSISLGVV